MKIHKTDQVFVALQTRFEQNHHRHPSMQWREVRAKLETKPAAISSLREMEATGGEPDVIGFDVATGSFLFCDCSAESPTGRRSLCYDLAALESRKEPRPRGSVVEAAASMGIELLTEEQYRQLQQLGEFDSKTSSWIWTPHEVRVLGGALFCDRRYGKVFVYHNGAPSYFAARGFRGLLRV